MKTNSLLSSRALTLGLAALLLPAARAAEPAVASPAAAGLQPAAAYTPSGAAYAWGYNQYGQLGNNSTTNSSVPVQVSSVANVFTNAGVTAVAAGGSFSLAVQNGAVYAWGGGSGGQLGNNSTGGSFVPVAVSSANGFTNTGVTAVAAGGGFSLAVQNGSLYAWGNNSYGQLGNNSTNPNSRLPVKVSANGTFTNTGVTAIAGGDAYSLAIQGGALYAWGNNGAGELGNGTTTQSLVPVAVSSANGFTNTGVTAVAAGGLSFTLAVQSGAVYAWGYNGAGELGNGTTTQSLVPVAVLNLSTGVTGVAAGLQFSLAVQNGHVFAWGTNNYGQLGNGTTANSSTPGQVSFGGSVLSNIVQVAAGQYSSYALARDGSLYVWGYDFNGELGDGGTSRQLTPEHLLPPTGQFYQLIDSDADGDHVLAILGDTAPVPEPGTWLGGVLLVGVGVLTLRRRAVLPS